MFRLRSVSYYANKSNDLRAILQYSYFFCVGIIHLINKMSHLIILISHMIVITSHMMVPTITLVNILNFLLFIYLICKKMNSINITLDGNSIIFDGIW